MNHLPVLTKQKFSQWFINLITPILHPIGKQSGILVRLVNDFVCLFVFFFFQEIFIFCFFSLQVSSDKTIEWRWSSCGLWCWVGFLYAFVCLKSWNFNDSVRWKEKNTVQSLFWLEKNCFFFSRFHNMALIAPTTMVEDIDHHTQVFHSAVKELLAADTNHHVAAKLWAKKFWFFFLFISVLSPKYTIKKQVRWYQHKSYWVYRVGSHFVSHCFFATHIK